jgi:hypothetical protein
MNKRFNAMLVALILLLIVFSSILGLVAYWLLWPYHPIDVHEIRILNKDKTIIAGESICYYIKWTKYTDKPGHLMRYFVNGHKCPLDDDTDGGSLVSAPKGPGEAEICLKTNESVSTGKGRMQWSVTYPMNPLNNFSVPPSYSDYFEIKTKARLQGEKGETGKTGPKGDKGDSNKTEYNIFRR